MSSSEKSESVPTAVSNFLRSHRAVAANLPEGEFRKCDLEGPVADVFSQLYADGVVERVDRVYTGEGWQGVWTVKPNVLQWVERSITTDDLLPCGHEPFRNLRDGGYTCLYDACDAEYSRAEIEAVIGNSEGSQ